MKKKNAIILAVTAGVVAVGLAVGLGVGLGLRNKDDNNDGGDEHAAYTVTKEEWEAAFDFTDKNCTLNIGLNMGDGSEITDLMSVRFVGGQDAWWYMDGKWKKDSAEVLSGEMNEGYMFYASMAYEMFAYDETSHSYKSTESWYARFAEQYGRSQEGAETEDWLQLVGEVKFQDEKLIYCAVTLNSSESEDEGGTYTTTVTDYGTTVKPAVAPAEGE